MASRQTPEPPAAEPEVPSYQIVEQVELNGGTYVRATCGEHETELFWAADTRQPTAEDIDDHLRAWTAHL